MHIEINQQNFKQMVNNKCPKCNISVVHSRLLSALSDKDTGVAYCTNCGAFIIINFKELKKETKDEIR